MRAPASRRASTPANTSKLGGRSSRLRIQPDGVEKHERQPDFRPGAREVDAKPSGKLDLRHPRLSVRRGPQPAAAAMGVAYRTVTSSDNTQM